MNERLGFIRSIIDAPDDDLPRLAFADWLQDRGEDERAEFIRVQCDIARFPGDPYAMSIAALEHGEVAPQDDSDPKQVEAAKHCQAELRRLGKLRNRESELLTQNYGLRWAVKELAPTSWFTFDGRVVGWWGWHRGFVEELRCPFAEFFKFVDALYWRKTFPCTNRSCVKGVCNDMDIGDIRCNEWACEVCHGSGFLPRGCPETAQPIRRVTLTDVPELIYTGDGHFTWEGYPCRVSFPPQFHHPLTHPGLAECLAVMFPGIEFKVGNGE